MLSKNSHHSLEQAVEPAREFEVELPSDLADLFEGEYEPEFDIGLAGPSQDPLSPVESETTRISTGRKNPIGLYHLRNKVEPREYPKSRASDRRLLKRRLDERKRRYTTEGN